MLSCTAVIVLPLAYSTVASVTATTLLQNITSHGLPRREAGAEANDAAPHIMAAKDPSSKAVIIGGARN